MNRLTKKVKYCSDIRTCLPMKYEQINNSNDCVDKLGQLEDIEEELGIDLITLFKALKYGIWFKNRDNGNINNGKPYCFIDTHNQLCLAIIYCYHKAECQYYQALDFCDYGKTWALTREELENESDRNNKL